MFITGLCPQSFFGTRNRFEENPPKGLCTSTMAPLPEIPVHPPLLIESVSQSIVECEVLPFAGVPTGNLSAVMVFNTHGSLVITFQVLM
jgi:hypothetical protein